MKVNYPDIISDLMNVFVTSKEKEMLINTSRTSSAANVNISSDKCTGCGTCTTICKAFCLQIKGGKAAYTKDALFECIGCGQCVTVCPHDAIMIEGRTLRSFDFFPLVEEKSSYSSLFNLMASRRSTRDFSDKPVDHKQLGKIIEAASQSPMGIPPSDVSVLVLDTKKKVKQFSFDFLDSIQSKKWFFSNWFIRILRPFMGKEVTYLFRNFLSPIFNFFLDKRKLNEDYLLYNAPAALYFYGTNYCDPADPLIPPTYAMLAAQSLGLGSCMIGSLHPFIKLTTKEFRQKYYLPTKMSNGILLIIGHPRYKVRKGIKRSFKAVNYA